MGKYRVTIILYCLFIGITLSSCSALKSTTSRGGTQKSPASVNNQPDGNDEITFIDDINITRDGKSTRHHAGAYHSPESPAVSGPASASALRLKYAELLDVSAGEIDNASLYKFIDNWWGAPYRYGGTSRDGIDCSAFVQALYAGVFGMTSLPRTAREQYDDSRKVKKKSHLKEGDLVFFRIRSRHISHVGVYLQNNKFVNASLSAGVTISDLTDPYWQRYYVCGGEPE